MARVGARRARSKPFLAPGLLPTSAGAMGMVPSVQFHPNTATITMRPNGTFQGYIVGNVLTVTTWVTTSAQILREGVQIINGAAAGTTILKPYLPSNPSANGSTGNWLVSLSQTVGSSGSPVTFTSLGLEAAGISDNTGNAPIAIAVPGTAPDCIGPNVMVDGFGRTFLRFANGVSASAWLRNLTLTGLDSANMTWFMAGMVRGTNPNATTFGQGNIAGIGVYGGAGGATAGSSNEGAALTITSGMPSINNSNLASTMPTTANLNKMFVGNQFQILGTCQATADGLNGSATLTGNAALRHLSSWLNEQSVVLTGSVTGSNRMINAQGFTINSAPNTSGTGGAQIDIYELVGFLSGQLGTVMGTGAGSAYAKAAQVSAAMMANWAVPPITKSITIGGDSRSTYGDGGNNEASNGSGYTVSSLLAEQGQPYSLPANVRIINYAAPGKGVVRNLSQIDDVANLFSAVPTCLNNNAASPYMLGGGNDYFAFFLGVNDVGSQTTVAIGEWPTTVGGGGSAVPTSVALGDDLYNGSGYAWTGVITNAANSTSATFTTTTGAPYEGMRITSAGFSPGQAMATVNTSTLAIGFSVVETTAHTSGVAATARADGYLTFVTTLVNRGVKVLAAAEPRTTGSGANPAQVELASNLLTHLISDTLAATTNLTPVVQVCDISSINVNGLYSFGLNFEGGANPGNNFADVVHLCRVGKLNLMGGANTPGLGYAAAIKKLLAS